MQTLRPSALLNSEFCILHSAFVVILSRRHLFMLAAGALLQQGADPVTREMLVRSGRPDDREMPMSGFLDYITPIDRFFVRSHVYTPTIDLNAWRLAVNGDVATPLTLSMDDLRRLPASEIVSVLECAGNGRGFYEPSMPGLQWGHGAVGNGRWRGVRLADVLKRAGVRESAKEILVNGADVPVGTMPDFQRSIPMAKALDPRTVLAYEMNGVTLPVKHGFPLRVVVPGWAGDSWIKWVTSISVLDREHDGFWMARAYRHPGRPVPPGTAVPPERMQPVTSLRIKSVIAEPLDGSQAAPNRMTTIRGAAWSGDAGPVASVEVSVDGGRTWNAASMRRDQRTEYGWRLWQYAWTPSREAYYTILARARDAAGNAQPFDQEWNPSGYAWNVVPRVGVSVVNGPLDQPPPARSQTSDDAPPGVLKQACLACHGDDVIRQQRLTRAQWDAEITKMTGWGAKVSNEDRSVLLDYLAGRYGPRRR
jgi:DMSO/TMAO reductase YedYZ molybdopterin-dependent catalytic subunit